VQLGMLSYPINMSYLSSSLLSPLPLLLQSPLFLPNAAHSAPQHNFTQSSMASLTTPFAQALEFAAADGQALIPDSQLNVGYGPDSLQALGLDQHVAPNEDATTRTRHIVAPHGLNLIRLPSQVLAPPVAGGCPLEVRTVICQ